MASTFPRRVDNVSDIMAVDVNRAYDALDYGWVEVSDTWAYASATTITVPTNATEFYQKGDRVRLKQGGAYKYYYIVTVAATLLTVTGGSDYTVANAAITDIAISRSFRPFGFPQRFDYVPTFAALTLGNGTLVSQFSICDGWVDVFLRLTFGSTTAVTGASRFSPPVTMVGTIFDVLGSGLALDNDVTLRHVLVPTINTTTEISINRGFVDAGSNSRTTSISSTTPFTWAVDDRIHITCRFRY